MGVSCSAPRDAGRAPDAGGGEGGESAAAASSALPATGFMQRLLDKVTGSSERAAPVMEAEPLSPKEAPAAAAVDPEDRMPLVGILVGRLSEEKLESMWRKYDPSDEGCLPKSKAAALLEDLIHYVPVYLRAVAQRSIAPIKKLAQEETDPLLRSGAVKLGAEFDNDVDKLVRCRCCSLGAPRAQRLALTGLPRAARGCGDSRAHDDWAAAGEPSRGAARASAGERADSAPRGRRRRSSRTLWATSTRTTTTSCRRRTSWTPSWRRRSRRSSLSRRSRRRAPRSRARPGRPAPARH
jgi:hypothetical protein